ncbi:hypothetical protein CDL12_03317 [Handroanthus impetiginosus]|uniref:Dirigent protein n=1 Tax=Handroanthus impetiginosus TaxID=429701 RepID=A0A2G9I2G2_9LAMI|nr:hypothetical protein CDL12_03317 [Handroanthus impetiginosus]
MAFHLIKSFFLTLALIISGASSARVLDEEPAAAASAPVPRVVPGGTTTTPAGGTTTPVAPVINPDDHSLTFFMHDILGGTHPSAIAVTGIPNGAVLPVNNGIPTDNANGGIVSNNNIPFLTGLSGFPSNTFQTNDGNNIIGGFPGFPVLNSAQFPSGTTLQNLMFGTMTVFDDELTEGHDLGSGLVGKAQGFYIASSEDGASQTMAFTVMFTSGSYTDSLSFLGVHRTAVAESHLAVKGGTGKYVNAKGFATVKTFPAANQHETDGMETLLQITVYLTY